jgi:hypothetical protein
VDQLALEKVANFHSVRWICLALQKVANLHSVRWIRLALDWVENLHSVQKMLTGPRTVPNLELWRIWRIWVIWKKALCLPLLQC